MLAYYKSISKNTNAFVERRELNQITIWIQEDNVFIEMMNTAFRHFGFSYIILSYFLFFSCFGQLMVVWKKKKKSVHLHLNGLIIITKIWCLPNFEIRPVLYNLRYTTQWDIVLLYDPISAKLSGRSHLTLEYFDKQRCWVMVDSVIAKCSVAAKQAQIIPPLLPCLMVGMRCLCW